VNKTSVGTVVYSIEDVKGLVLIAWADTLFWKIYSGQCEKNTESLVYDTLQA